MIDGQAVADDEDGSEEDEIDEDDDEEDEIDKMLSKKFPDFKQCCQIISNLKKQYP